MEFLTPFLKSTFNFELSKKKMSLYFRNYRQRNTWLRNCLTSPISEQPRIVKILKDPKHCWNLRDSSFFIFWSLWDNLGSKKSLLVKSKVLGLFVETLTADDKYSLCNKDILQQLIQMELCKKQKLLPQLSAASVKFTFNFQHFEKNWWASSCMSLRNYRPQMTLLLKCLKYLVSLGQSTC